MNRSLKTTSLGACGFWLAALLSLTLVSSAGAAQPPVGLGTAGSFAVLAGSTVTNTGPSVVNGDLGVSPGTAVTGFPPGTVNGTIHAADAVAGQAQTDTTTAYNDAAGRTPAVSVSGDLGGQKLTPGVFKSSSSLGLTGDVTLDAQGDPSAVFIFQVGSTLTTASSSRVVLTNGADACNVFWQIGSSATLGTNSSFKGTILALTSISLTTGATVDGMTLARNGAVTMDDNTITRANCASAPPRGTARLIKRKSFVQVKGRGIARVIFYDGRKRLKVVKHAPFRVNLGTGVHHIRARVYFRAGFGRPLTLRTTVRIRGSNTLRPPFTG